MAPIRIDGVSVEPALGDPDSMGPTALDIDCDLDDLASKMHLEVKLEDFKTMFAGRIRSCFTGKDAVNWCLRKAICSDEIDAVHLLNRMLRRGLMHHYNLNKLMENSPTAYYRFPQDHFKILVDQTGGAHRSVRQSVRHRLRPRAKTLHGEAALEERWYADVPTLPLDKVRNLGIVLQRLTSRDIQRGLRRHCKVFQGKEAVEVLIDSGVAKDVTDALAIGNAFLRAGLFHHVHLKYPLRNDDTLYRTAKSQYDVIMNRDHMAGMAYGSRAYNPDGGMDDSRVGTVTGPSSELKDVLDTQGRSALELATSSRYWTSYRASKLYVLNLYVMEGFIDMSDDWDSHVDQLFPTYCECYLTRDKEATTHSTIVSQKTLHPVWSCPVAFVDVDYLDAIRIDLKAHTQLGNDISIGSLEFAAHEVMGARNEPIVVEFDCGSRQVAECAAAIIKVQFDPAVAGAAEGAEGSKHHHILMNESRSKDDFPHHVVGSKGSSSRHQMRRSMRGSIRRTSLGATAEEVDPVYINVQGPHCCVLLDDDESSAARRVDSFIGIPLGLMGTSVVSTDSGTVNNSLRSSLHSLPGWWDPDRLVNNSALTTGLATNGARRASVTSSDTRRGSQQSDLPDIHEHDEFHGALPPGAGYNNAQVNSAESSTQGAVSFPSSSDMNIHDLNTATNSNLTNHSGSNNNNNNTRSACSDPSKNPTASGINNAAGAGSQRTRSARFSMSNTIIYSNTNSSSGSSSCTSSSSSGGVIPYRMARRGSCEPQMLRQGGANTGGGVAMTVGSKFIVATQGAAVGAIGDKDLSVPVFRRRLTWGGTTSASPGSTTHPNRM